MYLAQNEIKHLKAIFWLSEPFKLYPLLCEFDCPSPLTLSACVFLIKRHVYSLINKPNWWISNKLSILKPFFDVDSTLTLVWPYQPPVSGHWCILATGTLDLTELQVRVQENPLSQSKAIYAHRGMSCILRGRNSLIIKFPVISE